MSVRPRHLLACGTALLALGAGATPALAATTGHTPAAQDIITLGPKIQFDVGPMRTHAQQRKTRAALLVNEKACAHAARVVSHAYASPIQVKGRNTWVAGVRDEVTADREYAFAAKLLLKGHRAAAHKKLNEAYTVQMRGDVLIVHGEKQMGIFRFVSRNS